MLLLQLFNLLQREEWAAAGGGLLRVALSPFLEAACMSAPNVQAQILLVPRAEVAVLTSKGLGPCRHMWGMLVPTHPLTHPSRETFTTPRTSPTPPFLSELRHMRCPW